MKKRRRITRPTADEDRTIRRGIKADPDTFEPTDAEFTKMRPLRGRPLGSGTKIQLTLRLDRQIVDFFRATGPGWQTRLNDSLRKVVLRTRT